jgi:hypothetical protein
MKDASLLRRTLRTSDPGWGVLAVSVEWTVGMPLRRLSANFGGLSAEMVSRQGAAYPPRFSGGFLQICELFPPDKIPYREKNKKSRKINRIRRKYGPSALFSCLYKVMILSKSEENTDEMCGN